MFPIGDDNSGRRTVPVVSYTLIGLNVLVFLYQLTLSERALTDFIFDWGAVPNQISGGERLITLLSSQFMHGGWLHIGGNMLFLWVFGDNIEDTMGHARFLVFYLLTGVAAGLAQVLIDPNSLIPLVGASGAISGVLGAYIVLFPKGLIRTLVVFGFFVTVVMIPAWVQIGLWIVLQFVNGFASLAVQTRETGGGGVAFFAHIGGFLAGAVLVWLFRDGDAYERQKVARRGTRPYQQLGQVGFRRR